MSVNFGRQRTSAVALRDESHQGDWSRYALRCRESPCICRSGPTPISLGSAWSQPGHFALVQDRGEIGEGVPLEGSRREAFRIEVGTKTVGAGEDFFGKLSQRGHLEGECKAMSFVTAERMIS